MNLEVCQSWFVFEDVEVMTSEELSSKTETGMSGSGDQKQKHVAVVGGGLVRYC